MGCASFLKVKGRQFDKKIFLGREHKALHLRLRRQEDLTGIKIEMAFGTRRDQKSEDGGTIKDDMMQKFWATEMCCPEKLSRMY
ncbi:hypothetical protein [Roseovarius lutimaris]|uniref:hypothetical protein n=1 Tax=Roseovarius lutimaris TaxID=1005928 RepID=UPI000B859A59|nr:hypothetical protein [Roseovarius lutimaris]